ncbi:amino acid permease, partial [Pantoea agglomerans]
EAGIAKSPFVLVFEKIGIPYAADIFNFVILTAILSAANSGLYASGRMLWSLSNEGTLPRRFSRLTRRGIPLFAISVSMLGGLLALFSSVVAPDTVYVALSAISGFAVVAVWLSICASHYMFRRHHVRTGKPLSDLQYRAPWFPITPILGFLLCLLACVGLAFDPSQRIALWCGIPFVALCYGAYYFTQSMKKRRLTGVEDIA